MKFLKPDGSIEEGEPLTDDQAALRDEMERYLHIQVCKNAYHATYETEPCRKAANFLALKTTGAAGIVEVRNAIELITPRPRANKAHDDELVPATPAAAPASQPDVEASIAIPAEFDPF